MPLPYNYYNPYQAQPVMQQPQPQIQNGGFISVGSEAEARTYPIAPGNSITFKDETQPYVYVKTASFNQLDVPVFKKYRLVEEVQEVPQGQPQNDTGYEELRAELDELKEQVKKLQNRKKKEEDA